MNSQTESVVNMRPDAVGKPVSKIPVELSTRFLEHFSEQLYSSPQKAFEELISNGWDAGANIVDVRIAPDLKDPTATLAVFDNGNSMDEDGLRELWHIAFSPKQGLNTQHGRPVIGKFGIGKLATYVLAERLTYICKAADGVIRRVTMNYGEIDSQKGANSDSLINDLELDVFELNQHNVVEVLKAVHGGGELIHLINGDPCKSQVEEDAGDTETITAQDEFGGLPAELSRTESGTWTLVVLSDLKPTGQDLKLGILRRMLTAALPFGSEMSIYINGDRLKSSKLDATLIEQWTIGPALEIDYIELDDADGTPAEDTEDAPMVGNSDDDYGKKTTRFDLTSGMDPYPFIELPEVGRVTGVAKLFEEKISGGKSEERGASNGFHVNVLGRVVNQLDSSFGEENLNHAAWARFRMTVRADGLNEFLTTNREQFKERRGMKIFRAFLRRVFNKARTTYDSDINAIMPDGGDVLIQSLGVVSLNPLRSVVSETLRTHPVLPDLFDETGITDREEKRQSWRENTADNIRNALGKVKFEKMDDRSFVKFRINDSSIVVNKEHPFVMEHSRSKAEKELVRTVGMINLLADVYAVDIGIKPDMLDNVRSYRDKIMRFHALRRRKSGIYIAQLLQETQHDSQHSKRMEVVVSDALRYLGFDVLDLARPGEPEGVARAYSMPTMSDPTEENPNPPLYSFSFDAKSSKHTVAKTGNISLDAVVEHRERYKAEHALVIAPGFSDGALTVRCSQQRVTPMKAHDLGKLLKYTVEYGAIPITKFREVFDFFDPEGVSTWVIGLDEKLSSSRKLTIDVFLRALELLKGKVPDALPASAIALTCRESLGVVSVKEADVISLVTGLQIIVPDLVGISGDKVVVNANALRVSAAILAQLEKLHGEEELKNCGQNNSGIQQ